MANSDYRGIDYSGPNATCNRDSETGIRYGILPQSYVLQAWADSSEPDYGNPTCGYCGRSATSIDEVPEQDGDGIDIDLDKFSREEYESEDFACMSCEKIFGSESAYGDDPNGYAYEDEGIKAFSDSGGDIWVVKSPYYTRAQFCSPCAPGACHLSNPCESGEKAYCLPQDWYDDEVEPCPYPIYRVDTDELVYTPKTN